MAGVNLQISGGQASEMCCGLPPSATEQVKKKKKLLCCSTQGLFKALRLEPFFWHAHDYIFYLQGF